jgi:hypothetical protein
MCNNFFPFGWQLGQRYFLLFLILSFWVPITFSYAGGPIINGCQTGMNFGSTGTDPKYFTFPNGHDVTGNETWVVNGYPSYSNTVTINGTIRVKPGGKLTISSDLIVRFSDSRQNWDAASLNTNFSTNNRPSRILIEQAAQDATGTWVKGGEVMIWGGAKLTGFACNGDEQMWEGIQILGIAGQPQGVNAVTGFHWQGMLTTRNYLNLSKRVTIENAIIGVQCGEPHYMDRPELFDDYALDMGGGYFNCTYTDFLNCRIGARVWDYQYNYLQRTRFSKSKFLATGNLKGPGFSGQIMNYGLDLRNINRINIRGNTFECTISNRAYNQRGIGILCREDVGLHVASSCDEAPVDIPGCYGQLNEFKNLSYGIQADNNPVGQHFQILNGSFTNNWRGIRMVNIPYATVEFNQFTIPQLTQYNTGLANYGLYLESCTGYDVEANTFIGGEPANTIGVIVDNSIETDGHGGIVNQIYRNDFDNLFVGIQAQGTNGGSDPLSGDPYGLVFECNDFGFLGFGYFDMAGILVQDGATVNPNQGFCSLGASGSPVFNRFNDDCNTNSSSHFASGSQMIEYNPDQSSLIYYPDCVNLNVYVGGCSNSNSNYLQVCAADTILSTRVSEEEEDEAAAGGRFAYHDPTLKSRQKYAGIISSSSNAKTSADSAVIEVLRQLALHQLIRDYQNDTSAAATDSVVALLSRETLPSYRVQAASTLLSKGLTTAAQGHLQYAIAQGSQDPHTQLHQLWANLPAGSSLSDLTATPAGSAQLAALSQDTTQIGGDAANVLLCRANNQVFRERIQGSSDSSAVVRIKGVRAASGTLLSLQPNPAQENVTVTIAATGVETNMQINVFNLLGRKVVFSAIKTGQTTLDLDAATLPSGLYQVVLMADGKTLDKQKLVIIK